MRKSTFDNRPELLEQEGAVMRINFDVESVMESVPSMDGEQEGEREVFKAYVVRVPLPFSVESVMAALMAEGFDEFKSEAVACEALFVSGGSSDIDLAKQMIIARISAYDSSPEVNDLTVNGKHMWFDKATRASINYSMTVEKDAGETTTTLYDNDDVAYVLPIDTALGMFAQLELYAKACYNVTAAHKAAVMEKETLEDVLAYDYTTGYPQKLSFNLAE